MRKKKGYLLTETIVAIGVLTMIIAAVAILLSQFRNFNDYQLKRQRCVSAGLAQLDSITVTGKTLKAEKLNQLWQGVNSEIQIEQGYGKWQDFKLVTVTTTAKSKTKQAKVKQARYVSAVEELE